LKDVGREFTGEALLTKRICMAVLSAKIPTNKVRASGTNEIPANLSLIKEIEVSA
jgi:hypothetical protein